MGKDMERLAIVRKRREEQAAKRAVTGRKPGMSKNGLDNDDGESSEEEAPAVLSEAQAAKKAAALAVVDDSAESTNSLEIIKPIDIKKMNGDALKEALKARGLGTQGSKKDLISRLTDHEKQRAEQVRKNNDHALQFLCSSVQRKEDPVKVFEPFLKYLTGSLWLFFSSRNISSEL